MKIVADMNLSPEWVPLLDANGHSAIHWSKIGDPRAPDAEILQWAAQNDCVVFTNDLDFGALLAHSGRQLPSVFQLRTMNVSPRKIGFRVIALLKQFEKQLADGALVCVNDATERVRILPLR